MNMKKYFKYLSIMILIVSSCSTDDDSENINTLQVEVSDITDNGATLSWTTPSNLQSGTSVVYKVVLSGEVVAENLTVRTFTFEGLSDNVNYTGSIFALDSSGNETFVEFSFTTLPNPYYNGILTLSTQEEADNFYYTSVTALIIDGEDITDLSNLQSLQYVQRYIEIKNTSLTNLDGFQNTQTDSDLFPHLPTLLLENNNQMSDISAISDFSKKCKRIRIANSIELESLSGFEIANNTNLSLTNLSLQTLSWLNTISEFSSLRIDGLNQITSLSGLDSLESIDFNLGVHNCENLVSLSGANALNDVGGLYVKNNDLLTSLDGLTFSNTVGLIELGVSDNNNLADFCAIRSWVENNGIKKDYGEDQIINEYFSVYGNAYNPTLEQIRDENQCFQ